MKNRSYFVLTLCILLLTNVHLTADQKLNKLTQEEKNSGWELLWDGKTTEGWRAIYLDSFPNSGWVIKDGQLICLGEELPREKRGGAIITEKKYDSFELSFEFKIQEGANSGIKYFIDESLRASMGHGLGLDIHESPRLAAAQRRPLKAGMVITVEPGIYIPGWGGVRIEDDVVLIDGKLDILNKTPKDQFEL